MTDPDRWQEDNAHYLGAALNWLRLRLVGRLEPDSTTQAEVARAAEAVRAAEQAGPPAMVVLSRRFGLSRFEQEVLLLCAARELDPAVPGLLARANGEPSQSYPTFALALALFDEPAWDVLSPERPLRYWQMLEIDQAAPLPLTVAPLRADERIVHYLKGLNYLDERLTPLLTPLDGVVDAAALPASGDAVVATIARHLAGLAREPRLPVVQLLGRDSTSKQSIAWHAATRFGLHLYRLPGELLPASASERDALARLWQRETLLIPVALYLDAHDSDSSGTAALRRFVERLQGVVFLDSQAPLAEVGRPTLSVEVARPKPEEQLAEWEALLGPSADDSPQRLSGQFNLGLTTIRRIVRAVPAAPTDGRPLRDHLWDACLAETRPALDALAQRLDPRVRWDDLVLPAAEMALLRQIAAQVGQGATVYQSWGWGARMTRGLGLSVLFAGESGTGKTLAAEVLAGQVRLPLYRIDLSAVVSKYIGETEKNLRRLFDAAEDGGAILLFDEADALFGKRSEVKDSHDRYANIEINYLLQRMEAFRGLSILATNQKSALDQAFLRRLRFQVQFPFPGPAERLLLWEKVFPEATPRDRLDYERLARLTLTGGSIQNVALNAAFLAAQAGTPVTMALVLDAARGEVRKLERPLNEADFRL